MTGVFDLESPADLLAKLGRELERLRAEPLNVDHAFNLFVTAEHILDWLHPGPANNGIRADLRDSQPLLQIVSHLANGAKHFDKLMPHHKSVSSTGRQGSYFSGNYFPQNYFGKYFGESKLVVRLDGAAAEKYGATVAALVLAEDIYQYWSTEGRIPA